MKTVIIGGGKVGVALATQLTRESHDVTFIDNNRSVVKRIGESLDVLAMYGNGADLSLQRQADIGNADLLMAVTPLDELNILCCIIAKKLGCQNAIARVRNPEYSKQMYFIREELGLNFHVNPEQSASREIFRLMQYKSVIKRDSFAKGRIEIIEIDVEKGSMLDGITLAGLSRKIKTKVLVCAIQRDGTVRIPDGNVMLHAGDRIHVTAATLELVALIETIFKQKNTRSENVMIVGGSRITQYLADALIKVGTNVKIIEINKKKAMALAEKLPRATIIFGDGTNQNLLNSENISQMDTVVALTDMDEENLIISLYAKYVGVKQVITKLNRTEYADLFQGKGIDSIVSPKMLCAQEIISYVRALQNTDGNSAQSVHHLINGKIEALEFIVTESTSFRNIPLKNLKLKKNILLTSIQRKGQTIIPAGDDVIETEDIVVIVSLHSDIILDLNDILQGE